MKKRARHLNTVLNHFWRRWRKEYLLELREAHRQRQAGAATATPVKLGDIVLIHDQDHPRGFWKVGQVEQLISGRDGQVRGALPRLPQNRQPTTLQCPHSIPWRLPDLRIRPHKKSQQTRSSPNPQATTARICIKSPKLSQTVV